MLAGPSSLSRRSVGASADTAVELREKEAASTGDPLLYVVSRMSVEGDDGGEQDDGGKQMKM